MNQQRETGWYWAKATSNGNPRPYFRGAAGWDGRYKGQWSDDTDFFWIDAPENRITEPK